MRGFSQFIGKDLEKSSQYWKDSAISDMDNKGSKGTVRKWQLQSHEKEQCALQKYTQDASPSALSLSSHYEDL